MTTYGHPSNAKPLGGISIAPGEALRQKPHKSRDKYKITNRGTNKRIIDEPESRRFGVWLLHRSAERGEEFLCVKQSESGFWGIPKGQMELGETGFGCASRELMEETGIVMNERELRAGLQKAVTRWSHTIYIVVTRRRLRTFVDSTQQDEISQAKWMTLSELKKESLSNATKYVARQVMKWLKHVKIESKGTTRVVSCDNKTQPHPTIQQNTANAIHYHSHNWWQMISPLPPPPPPPPGFETRSYLFRGTYFATEQGLVYQHDGPPRLLRLPYGMILRMPFPWTQSTIPVADLYQTPLNQLGINNTVTLSSTFPKPLQIRIPTSLEVDSHMQRLQMSSDITSTLISTDDVDNHSESEGFSPDVDCSCTSSIFCLYCDSPDGSYACTPIASCDHGENVDRQCADKHDTYDTKSPHRRLFHHSAQASPMVSPTGSERRRRRMAQNAAYNHTLTQWLTPKDHSTP